jgi:hypothetical protein
MRKADDSAWRKHCWRLSLGQNHFFTAFGKFCRNFGAG